MLTLTKHDVLEELKVQLQSGSSTDRAGAADQLRSFGSDAVEPLCHALRDGDRQVRVAAAESLAEVGDERAVQPLIEALRASFVGRSARWQIVTTVVLAVAVVLMGILWGAMLLQKGAVAFGLFNLARLVWEKHNETRQPRSRLVLAITEALEQIAERNPTPEIRNAVPDLRAVAVDVVRQEKSIREASREAAVRIEALTEKLKSMPLPAAAPAPAAEALPRPAEAPRPDAETLPRVAQ